MFAAIAVGDTFVSLPGTRVPDELVGAGVGGETAAGFFVAVIKIGSRAGFFGSGATGMASGVAARFVAGGGVMGWAIKSPG